MVVKKYSEGYVTERGKENGAFYKVLPMSEDPKSMFSSRSVQSGGGGCWSLFWGDELSFSKVHLAPF